MNCNDPSKLIIAPLHCKLTTLKAETELYWILKYTIKSQNQLSRIMRLEI